MTIDDLRSKFDISEAHVREGCWRISPILKAKALSDGSTERTHHKLIEKGRTYEFDIFDQDGAYPNTIHCTLGYWWPLKMFEIVE